MKTILKTFLFIILILIIFIVINNKNSNQPKKIDLKETAKHDSLLIIAKQQVLEDLKTKKSNVDDQLINEKKDRLGIWEIGTYADEFGDLTKKKFITTKRLVKGLFSNSATENSDLSVCLLIDSEDKISLQLFEYGRNNPVKGGIVTYYRLKIKQDIKWI